VETNCIDTNDILLHWCFEMLRQNEPQAIFWFQRDGTFKGKGSCGPTGGFFITAAVFGPPSSQNEGTRTLFARSSLLLCLFLRIKKFHERTRFWRHEAHIVTEDKASNNIPKRPSKMFWSVKEKNGKMR